MLYHLTRFLTSYYPPFGLFDYRTVRAGLSILTALLISVLLGPVMIRWLKAFNIGQHIRKDEAPALHDLHKTKAGTPTMGGVLIVTSIVTATLLWADLSVRLVWLVLGVVVWLGFIGFLDDYIKLRNKRSLGLRAKPKFVGQALCGLALGVYLYLDPVSDVHVNKVDLFLVKDLYIPLGMFYILFVALVLCGTSNAVNLTDGLDGLAIGSVVMAALAFAGIAYAVGRTDFSEYLRVPYVEGADELTIFCTALVGAGLGFLWFNCPPAEIFMGDTGSLALGGALGAVAVLLKKELLLVIVGGLFVMEAFSVIIQVLSFKTRRKRVFLMAPLHHHFELRGWSETKVVVRFWILAAMFGLLSLAALKVY